MTRGDFVDFLTRAVANALITEEEAISLLARFDAGELDEDNLPLPLQEVIQPATEEDNSSAWLLLLALALLGGAAPSAWTSYLKRRAANGLQDLFAEEAANFAAMLVGSGGVGSWQIQMRDLIQRHYLQQAQLGLGRSLMASELAEVNGLLLRAGVDVPGQLEALAMYGEEEAIRLLTGEEVRSEAYHANRSTQYAGAALGLFYVMSERDEGDEGWVVRYVSRDDPRVCPACQEAEERGPYLLNARHPYPGSICYGKGRCRCELHYEYNPSEYRRLTGVEVRQVTMEAA